MSNEAQQPEGVAALPDVQPGDLTGTDELQVEAAADALPPEPPKPLGEPPPAEEPGDTLSDPVEVIAPLDPHAPMRWIEQDGPPRERKLPAAGQIHIQWQMIITGHQGVIYENAYDFVHRNIDSPAHVHKVGESIQKIIQGTLFDPLGEDLSLYTVTRCGQVSVKAPPAPQALNQIADSPPLAPQEMTPMPPPLNPGAKI